MFHVNHPSGFMNIQNLLQHDRIKLPDNESCTGCSACISICPKNSISMCEDKEGFLQPYVDNVSCILCHKCEDVCPIISPAQKDHYEIPFIYAAYSRNENTRIDSTSGGMFSELAIAFFQNKNYVSGAIFNDNHTVSHILTDDITRLPELRSSKYVQSEVSTIFPQIKKVLNAQKKVLFCGTPCQVAGLLNYLGGDKSNLTTIDFICRGVNSPKVFLSYMNMLEREYNAKAISIKFKNKRWGWHRFSMRVFFSNGKEYCLDRYHDLFFIGYLQYGNFCRRSCYQCKFKGFPQFSDITLADFWGIEKLDITMDQDKGTSLVLINSRKGNYLFNSIKSHIVFKSFSPIVLNDNRAANSSLTPAASNRDDFFGALERLPFEDVARIFFEQ